MLELTQSTLDEQVAAACSAYTAPRCGQAGLLPLHRNENLFGPSPRIQQLDLTAIVRGLNRYPAASVPSAAQVIARHLGVDETWLLMDHGATAVIHHIFRCSLSAGKSVLLHEPCWGFYRSAADAIGARIASIDLVPDAARFELDADAAIDAIERVRPALVVLCSPNNPTGSAIPLCDVRRITESCPDTLVLLDEAYHGFVERDERELHALLRSCPNLVVVRSFSKLYGLAGLRVGYGLCHPTLAARLGEGGATFGIPDFAAQVLDAALSDREYYAGLRRAFSLARHAFSAQVNAARTWRAYESEANFVLVEHLAGDVSAALRRLERAGYAVKRQPVLGRDSYLRIALHDATTMARVADALLGGDDHD